MGVLTHFKCTAVVLRTALPHYAARGRRRYGGNARHLGGESSWVSTEEATATLPFPICCYGLCNKCLGLARSRICNGRSVRVSSAFWVFRSSGPLALRSFGGDRLVISWEWYRSCRVN